MSVCLTVLLGFTDDTTHALITLTGSDDVHSVVVGGAKIPLPQWEPDHACVPGNGSIGVRFLTTSCLPSQPLFWGDIHQHKGEVLLVLAYMWTILDTFAQLISPSNSHSKGCLSVGEQTEGFVRHSEYRPDSS